MSRQSLEEIVELLRKNDQYRVVQKYKKPLGYNLNNDIKNRKKFVGAFVDIEATGLLYSSDKLIELGMVKFEYTECGHILYLLQEFNSYQDPNIIIPDHITKLTGISNDMVKGHSISEDQVSEYLKDVDIIIAHNAQFDRAFFESTFPNIKPKAWACSMRDINWRDEDISSLKLEYIAYRYNFFFDCHRAINDCLAGIHILAQNLMNSKIPVLRRLLDNSSSLGFKLWAKNAPYDCKDLLKARGYRWGSHITHNFKAWYITMTENEVEEEIKYLRSSVYISNRVIPLEIEIFDAFNKYSIVNLYTESTNEKYLDKLLWVKELCN